MKNALKLLPVTQTMSSLEIAKLTGKRHSDVLIDIRRILEEVEIRTTDFSAVYLSEQNKELPCFNLPRRECDLVISGYSVKYRLAIIDRWHELEALSPKIPQTYISALEALIESEKEKERYIEETKKLNTLLDKEFGYCSILRASIYLGVHETIFKWQALKARTIQLGYEVKKVPSPRFGHMNLYHLTAFKECYPEFDFDDLTPELVDNKQELAIL